MKKTIFAILIVAITSSVSIAQSLDKKYTLTLTWGEWLKIGSVLDKQSIGEFVQIYNNMQVQFRDQNLKEQENYIKSIENNVKSKTSAGEDKSND
jgi:hypothetical protein